jgi:hypothetical protein
VKPIPHDKGRTSPVIFVNHSFTGSSGSQVFENVQKQENPIGDASKGRPMMAFSAQPDFYRSGPGVSGGVRCPI